MEDIGTSFPGRVIDYALETGILNKKEASSIWYDNVLNWLGKKEI